MPYMLTLRLAIACSIPFTITMVFWANGMKRDEFERGKVSAAHEIHQIYIIFVFRVHFSIFFPLLLLMSLLLLHYINRLRCWLHFSSLTTRYWYLMTFWICYSFDFVFLYLKRNLSNPEIISSLAKSKSYHLNTKTFFWT